MAPLSAPLPTMAKQSTPKTMSSRLMTMKFMQRGAAAAAAEAASPSTPKTEEEGSALKRRKTQHSSTPTTPNTPLFDEHKVIQAALEEEERKRQIAIERRAAELGDSHWVLDGVASATNKKAPRAPLKVVQVGYAQIDYSGTIDDSRDDPLKTVDISTKARLQFNMKSKSKDDDKDNTEHGDDSGSSNDESEEGEVSPDPREKSTPRGHQRGDDSTPPNKRARSSLSARQNEERQKALELAGKRRKKEVKLNQLTSISGAGASQKISFACHRCGKPGHKAAECPSNSKKQKR